MNDRLQQAIRAFEQQASQAAQLKETIQQLRGHGRNTDGSVVVTVAPSGAVLGLQLGPAATQRTHTQLQQEIMAAIRQATRQAAAAMEEAVRPMVGARYDQFREAINAHASDAVPPIGPSAPPHAAALPPPAPGMPQAPAPAPRSRRTAPDDDHGDDFGDDVNSILRG